MFVCMYVYIGTGTLFYFSSIPAFVSVVNLFSIYFSTFKSRVNSNARGLPLPLTHNA